MCTRDEVRRGWDRCARRRGLRGDGAGCGAVISALRLRAVLSTRGGISKRCYRGREADIHIALRTRLPHVAVAVFKWHWDGQ